MNMQSDAPSLWTRYWQSIHFKSDLKQIFFREHNRYAVVDGIRATTIMLMVLFHVLYGVVKLLDEHVDEFIATFPSAWDWLWLCQGSDPLFVVCGLLVSYSCFREYDKTNDIKVLRFYGWRLLRIYPLYFVAMMIYVHTDPRYPGYIWSNLFFASNFFENQKFIIPVSWSVDVQMHFYLLLPWICFLIYAVRWRIAMLVALCAAAVAYRYWLIASHPELYSVPFYEIIYDRDFARSLSDLLYYDIDARLAAFLFGMLAAYLHHYHGKVIVQFFQKHMIVNTLVLALGVWLIYWSFSIPIHNKEADFYHPFNPDDMLWFWAFNRYAYSLGMSIIILMVMCPVGLSNFFKWVCAWPIWHPFAQLIYPIYLFHFPFILIGAVIVFGTTDKDAITAVTAWQVFGIYGWAALLTVLFSIFAHIYLEKPFIAMRTSKPSEKPKMHPVGSDQSKS